MIEALLAEKLDNHRVRCRLCGHGCVIPEGRLGICRVRKNIGGMLFSLNADQVAAANLDPIEKKPLYHFLPGSRSFSIAAMGCNFSCRFCQNYSLSMVEDEAALSGETVSPEELVRMAVTSGSASISYTYTEPTVFFELMLETAKLARRAGLLNVMVSNGFLSGEALEMLAPYLDAANIDLKSFSDDFYRNYCRGRLQPVLDTIARMKARAIWLEITTLLIPGLNDSETEIEKLIGFLLEVDARIPWHVSRFFPQYQLLDTPPTDTQSIHHFLELGNRRGLSFVYSGNLQPDRWSDTLCPSCGAKLIQRVGYQTKILGLHQGHCDQCRIEIPGVWNRGQGKLNDG